MARFDICEMADGNGLVVDCQADILSGLNTRFVIPLIPLEEAPTPAGRLNPIFVFNGRKHVLVTQFAAAIMLREIGATAGSLRTEETAVTNALDMLLTGY